ncbi:hypothetical protein K2173_027773 [Erythroxylum novogranatense]|uniref:RING-type E3 ubiquitin transferase n=1 Tax=Erythroxylum novogranatense TaxID=1862640 RepID=A0AAV8U017_9ROSI|nr:hypothetical protein K2173_027773 [Erythroxylum novogranatense]
MKRAPKVLSQRCPGNFSPGRGVIGPIAETASPATTPVSDADTLQLWCRQCNKRVAVDARETIVVCCECRNGFVELIPQTSHLPSDAWSLTYDQAEDAFLDSRYRQALRIALAGVDYGTDTSDAWSLTSYQVEDSTTGSYYRQMLRRLGDPQSADDFLGIELNGWDNDEEDGESKDKESRNED